MKIKLLDHKHLPGFNSGTGMEYHNENLYLTDLDNKEILVLNSKWKEEDRLPLFQQSVNGNETAHSDLQAATLVEINKIPRLLALGTDFRDNAHNKAVLLNLDSKKREDFTIDEFDARLKNSGLEELNIKAAAIVLGKLVLGNSRSSATTENNFVVTDIDLWKKQDTEEIVLAPIRFPEMSTAGISLSGMCYSSENDWLILTFVSDGFTEDGSNDDATTSYLALVENASRKIARHSVKINEFVALPQINHNLDGKKIKATCIQRDKAGRVKLFLVADHAEGGSEIFKMRIKH